MLDSLHNVFTVRTDASILFCFVEKNKKYPVYKTQTWGNLIKLELIRTAGNLNQNISFLKLQKWKLEADWLPCTAAPVLVNIPPWALPLQWGNVRITMLGIQWYFRNDDTWHTLRLHTWMQRPRTPNPHVIVSGRYIKEHVFSLLDYSSPGLTNTMISTGQEAPPIRAIPPIISGNCIGQNNH